MRRARGGADGARLHRERTLLRAHGRAWAAPLADLITEYKFYRGFIGEVTLPLDRFLDVAPTLFAAAPIQHLNLTAPRTRLAELLQSPHLARLTSLALEELGLGDEGARTIARAEGVRTLRWLSLAFNRIGQPGVEALTASPWLANLAVLDSRATRAIRSRTPPPTTSTAASPRSNGRRSPTTSSLATARGPGSPTPKTPTRGRCRATLPPALTGSPLPMLKLARTNAEAHLFMDLRPCACGERRFARQSSIVTLEGDRASRYTGACARCGAERRFEFRIPEEILAPPASGSSSAAPSRRSCSIPASGSASPTTTPAACPSAPSSTATRSASRATTSPPPSPRSTRSRSSSPLGAVEVPLSAFFTPLGRAIWDKEPGRFRRVRLEAVRKAYADAAARL